MTANNIESVELTTASVEISSQTNEIVETELAGETDEVKRETKALIEALRRRAQTEAESAGTLTRETYVNAVRQVRAALEREKLFPQHRLEYTWAVFQDETERNWHLLMKEVTDFSVRLQKAAKAGWEAFNE